MGTGNDFVKYYPDKSFKSVEGIIDGTHHQIDILQINKTRFSVNVCNCGFESIVCSIANRLSAKGETDPYNKGIIKAIIFRRRNRLVVHADGERLNNRTTYYWHSQQAEPQPRCNTPARALIFAFCLLIRQNALANIRSTHRHQLYRHLFSP